MWTKMCDMELSDEDKFDLAMPFAGIMTQPDYPSGLKICLTERELEKLKLKPDCEVGDILDMRCFGVVTSVRLEKANGKDTARVEIQIERIAVEDENHEQTPDEEEDEDDA